MALTASNATIGRSLAYTGQRRGCRVCKALSGDVAKKVAIAKASSEAQARDVKLSKQAAKRAADAGGSAMPTQDIPEALRSSHGPLYYTGDEFDSDYFSVRTSTIHEHFPGAMGVDDFMSRVEICLYQAGFTGENSIAVVNLCRDEVVHKLAAKVHSIFGHSFSTHGLGGVITCGVTGLKAGISHAPTDANGREKYVFFSFPHIAIDSEGNVGSIHRPGRVGTSSACGALCACLNCLKSGDASLLEPSAPGTHDVTDPELSILKQRLLRTIKSESVDAGSLDLVSLTKLAEKTQARDLQMLIDAAVDTNMADYAVITGVQIHNWMSYPGDAGAPDLEYLWPAQVKMVVNGKETNTTLDNVVSLTPRQIRILAHEDLVSGGDPGSPLHAQDSRKRQKMVTNLLRQAFDIASIEQ